MSICFIFTVIKILTNLAYKKQSKTYFSELNRNFEAGTFLGFSDVFIRNQPVKGPSIESFLKFS